MDKRYKCHNIAYLASVWYLSSVSELRFAIELVTNFQAIQLYICRQKGRAFLWRKTKRFFLFRCSLLSAWKEAIISATYVNFELCFPFETKKINKKSFNLGKNRFYKMNFNRCDTPVALLLLTLSNCKRFPLRDNEHVVVH